MHFAIPAAYATDEIQVYNAEIAPKGVFTIQQHLNYVWSGSTTPDFLGGVEMGAALLALHRSTGDRKWLTAATAAADFIANTFIDPKTGGFFASASPDAKNLPKPIKLLAEQELSNEPVHVTVVGPKDDPRSVALHAGALAYPLAYKRVEWWDKREGKLTNADVDYPDYPDGPAAFVCTRNFCSLPVTDAAAIPAQIDRLQRALPK